jgi:hypothetical protein
MHGSQNIKKTLKIQQALYGMLVISFIFQLRSASFSNYGTSGERDFDTSNIQCESYSPFEISDQWQRESSIVQLEFISPYSKPQFLKWGARVNYTVLRSAQ